METVPILKFLSKLNINNNREWFAEHKKEFDATKVEFELLVTKLIYKFKKDIPMLSGLQAKDCIFRIYKDIRFSRNKLPYKTNFGAVIGVGGRKSKQSAFYIQIEPNNSFVAFGCYMPESSNLKLIRQFIFDEIDEFNSILNAPDFKKYFGTLATNGDELKRIPKGFPSDCKFANLLKYKHYICTHTLSDKDIESSNLIEHLYSVFKAGKDFSDFLNSAIAED